MAESSGSAEVETVKVCKWNLPYIIRMSTTPNNHGRAFFGCQKYKLEFSPLFSLPFLRLPIPASQTICSHASPSLHLQHSFSSSLAARMAKRRTRSTTPALTSLEPASTPSKRLKSELEEEELPSLSPPIATSISPYLKVIPVTRKLKMKRKSDDDSSVRFLELVVPDEEAKQRWPKRSPRKDLV